MLFVSNEVVVAITACDLLVKVTNDLHVAAPSDQCSGSPLLSSSIRHWILSFFPSSDSHHLGSGTPPSPGFFLRDHSFVDSCPVPTSQCWTLPPSFVPAPSTSTHGGLSQFQGIGWPLHVDGYPYPDLPPQLQFYLDACLCHMPPWAA